ncbi:bifunctional methylenetetrahydrofolate dehydrogenase/methenyltetrahydrofolate cyclohydrolase FolD [Kiritimatiella glycovorans]|uniref:Bifunctional protein FolD n=1 Tax=Kiritimatiella glycovorans TaxID=1307763 RepID=A0A0G3EJV7_9BACT|nr:bifunctional methylenetetrahydrofolate dehydrogenase/methenyltetrahydrofolate cyclohydrolase FolD [Kiritimatiella glycovorans]AKJ65075.1 Bifunctional protein FolD protein [Kiritimatiella glycovorans]
MSADILDGKQIAADIREELKRRAAELTSAGVTPGLGVLLVGDDPASRSYVTAKERACEKVGLHSQETVLPASASREEILEVVRGYNADERIHGILVQLPLPDSAMEADVIETILPEKDADGFHPVSVGRMMLGLPAPLPCTPHGILQILKRSGVTIEGAHAVVVGRSNIVGKPVANLLSRKWELGNATVTVCHTRTKDLGAITRQADILIAAAGKHNMISADMVREGAVVIDVGVNRIEDPSAKRGYRLRGDVDFEAVREKAAAITPVPGGVGPMTITMLLQNTVEAAERVVANS